MSNYKTHTKFNLLLALPLLIAGGAYFLHLSWLSLAIFSATFSYTTLFMSPDLDLAHQIKIASVRGFFSIPFRLYGQFFKHRGLSHAPILGSVTRILWLSAFCLLITFAISQSVPGRETFLSFFLAYKEEVILGFSGICIADLCHLLLDL